MSTTRRRPTTALAVVTVALALIGGTSQVHGAVRVASGPPYSSSWDHLFDYTEEQASDGRPSRYCAACEKPCGAQPEESRRLPFAKIVNGKDARENEFGWAATLARRGQFYCGGTLITRKHVLTAAHCVENFSPKDLTVTIGEHDRKVDTGRRTVHQVAKIHRHPDFRLSTFDNDIAIIELRDAAPIDKPWIRVACLPKSEHLSYVGTKGTVIGWGRLGERKKSSNILQKVDVPIISNEDCKDMGYAPEKITSNMICAGYKEGQQDACQGDSGGPMHRQLDSVGDSPSVLEVIGIVSWGKGCARENYPGVYTRVANYLDWIMDHTGDECVCGAESS